MKEKHVLCGAMLYNCTSELIDHCKKLATLVVYLVSEIVRENNKTSRAEINKTQ